jgi:hypothetical protein
VNEKKNIEQMMYKTLKKVLSNHMFATLDSYVG